MSLVDTYADRIDWQDDGSAIFTLRRPLKTSAGGDVETLTVRRPLLEDMLAREKAAGDDFSKIVIVLTRVTGVSKMAEFDKIDGEDCMVLAEIMSQMLEYGEPGTVLDRHEERLTMTDHDASLLLRLPIKTLQGEADEIVVRRPTLGEVRTNQGPTLAASVKLLAILTGLGPNVLGKVDAVDGMIMSDLVKSFLGKSRQQTVGAQ
jgi:hypothetical protein